MSNRFEDTVSRLVGDIVVRVGQHQLLTILLAISTAIACGWYSASHVRINTDTADMLSDDLAWRSAYNDFKRTFPFLNDTIVVVVDAPTPDLASEVADKLASTLRQRQTVFSDVFHPAGDHFFRSNQLLYLNLDELQTLNDEISTAQPFLARLAVDPSLYGLLGLMSEIATSAGSDFEHKLVRIFHSINSAIESSLNGDQTPMSWQQFFIGDALTPSTRVIFTVKPKMDFGSIQPGAIAVSEIRQATTNLGYEQDSDVRVRLTGAAALSYDELNSVTLGTKRAGFLALILVAVCLFIGLQSISLVTATLLTLVTGLILTASFAIAAVGTLNMISIAFAVLYVGLGVDFAIHICLRYRELSGKTPKALAISEASRHVGPSLFLCALTTAISFFAFIPTTYRGVAELGLISGVGMFIGLACSLTVLPALLSILPTPSNVSRSSSVGSYLAELPHRKARTILTIAAVFGIASTFVLPITRFDHNPIRLNDPSAESVTTFLELLEDSDEPPYSISLIASSAAEALEMTEQLVKKPTVRTVTSPLDFLPANQDQKFGHIDDLVLILGGRVVLGETRPITEEEILERLTELRAHCALLAGGQPSEIQAAASSLAKTLQYLESRVENSGFSLSLLALLERKLLHHFGPQIERLNTSLDAVPIGLDTLPENFRRRWVTKNERFRLEIYPKQNLDDNENLHGFVTEVQAIAGPLATGTPVINMEASRAVIDAFLQAFLTALIVIAFTLYLILRKMMEVLVVMIPIVLAGLLTTAGVTLAGIPFNFANIIALPLLMGIGVDSALHMLHRHKFLAASDGPLLTTSTARAVLFSALTTTASFGNLAFSPHAGTASMGVLLTLGLGLTLFCMLIVMPALLTHFVKPRSSVI